MKWTAKHVLQIALGLLLLNACGNRRPASPPLEPQVIVTPTGELHLPAGNARAVLVLFGGYPDQAADVRREFAILEQANARGVAVLLMNFSQHLWLEPADKAALAQQIKSALNDHHLPADRVFLGGFSSGGNVALLLGNHLLPADTVGLCARGVFAVDAPVDLVGLYRSAEKNVVNNFSATAVAEGNFLLDHLRTTWGTPEENLAAYERFAPFTAQTQHIDNLLALKNTPLRLYTEPDSAWWRENRRVDFAQTNAFQFRQLDTTLRSAGFTQVERIETHHKGYRANGDRHPHSWSIVDVPDLLDWVLRAK